MSDSTRKEIILCPDCKGEGYTYQQVSVDDSDYVQCVRCNTFGRVYILTVTSEIPLMTSCTEKK